MHHKNRNHFVSQNNDLIIMLGLGMGLFWGSHNIAQFSFEHQLIGCGAFALLSGVFNGKSTPILEWSLCFFFGGLIAACGQAAWPMLLLEQFQVEPLIPVIIQTGTWYGFLLGPLVVGFAIGSAIGHKIIGDYWQQKTICS